MSLARNCPRRHDGICRATGEHDFRCPETEQAVVAHTAGGQFAKGVSGHKYPLKTLRKWRDAVRKDGTLERMWKHYYVLTGLMPRESAEYPAGTYESKPTVQLKGVLRFFEMYYGRKYEVEVTGAVQHEVDVVVSRGVDPRVEALSIEEKRALLEAMRPLQRQVAAPAASGEAVDAEFEESPTGGKKEES